MAATICPSRSYTGAATHRTSTFDSQSSYARPRERLAITSRRRPGNDAMLFGVIETSDFDRRYRAINS